MSLNYPPVASLLLTLSLELLLTSIWSLDNLYFQSSGRRFVPSGDSLVAAALAAGQDIDPAKYYFRLKLILESDDPHLDVQEVCRKVVIASAVRGESSIVYDAYVLD